MPHKKKREVTRIKGRRNLFLCRLPVRLVSDLIGDGVDTSCMLICFL
jgi:hypothetical protein